jgi:hypothetical protein
MLIATSVFRRKKKRFKAVRCRWVKLDSVEEKSGGKAPTNPRFAGKLDI